MNTSPTILIVPGLRDHVEEHWQTILERKLPKACSVAPLEHDKLSCAARVEALQQAIAKIDGPIVLVAHRGGVDRGSDGIQGEVAAQASEVGRVRLEDMVTGRRPATVGQHGEKSCAGAAIHDGVRSEGHAGQGIDAIEENLLEDHEVGRVPQVELKATASGATYLGATIVPSMRPSRA